jgi:hypothetical protein
MQMLIRHVMPGLKFFIGLDFIKDKCNYAAGYFAAVLIGGTDVQYLEVFNENASLCSEYFQKQEIILFVRS